MLAPPQASPPMRYSGRPATSPVALGGTLQPLTLDVTVGYELARET